MAQSAVNPQRQRTLTDEMARRNTGTFKNWQRSPFGLSAQGFGRIDAPLGQAKAKAQLKAAQR
jgi:hypothetical protein